jgi:hypothetical protein
MAFATASRQIGNAFPPPVAYTWPARRTRPPDQGQSQYGASPVDRGFSAWPNTSVTMGRFILTLPGTLLL